jgi:hypothetical protein
MSPPPTPGPADQATTRLASNLALASISCSRATTDGKKACEAISKSVEKAPLTAATTQVTGRRWNLSGRTRRSLLTVR